MEYISPAKIILGREEYILDRLSRRSNAMRASLMMTIVWPRTVMELIGPTELTTVMDSWSQGYTIGILELQPVDPVLLSWRRKVCEIANDRLRGRAWG